QVVPTDPAETIDGDPVRHRVLLQKVPCRSSLAWWPAAGQRTTARTGEAKVPPGGSAGSVPPAARREPWRWTARAPTRGETDDRPALAARRAIRPVLVGRGRPAGPGRPQRAAHRARDAAVAP